MDWKIWNDHRQNFPRLWNFAPNNREYDLKFQNGGFFLIFLFMHFYDLLFDIIHFHNE